MKYINVSMKQVYVLNFVLFFINLFVMFLAYNEAIRQLGALMAGFFAGTTYGLLIYKKNNE